MEDAHSWALTKHLRSSPLCNVRPPLVITRLTHRSPKLTNKTDDEDAQGGPFEKRGVHACPAIHQKIVVQAVRERRQIAEQNRNGV